MSHSKTTTTKPHRQRASRPSGSKRASLGQGAPRRRKTGKITRAAKAVVSFLTDPDYPKKAASSRSRHRGELIA